MEKGCASVSKDLETGDYPGLSVWTQMNLLNILYKRKAEGDFREKKKRQCDSRGRD